MLPRINNCVTVQSLIAGFKQLMELTEGHNTDFCAESETRFPLSTLLWYGDCGRGVFWETGCFTVSPWCLPFPFLLVLSAWQLSANAYSFVSKLTEGKFVLENSLESQ